MSIEFQPDPGWSRKLVDELIILGDEQYTWSADSLFAASNDLFRPNSADIKPELHNYWAKFILANPTQHEQWVSFESYYWDFVTLHIRDSTGSVTIVSLGVLSKPYDNKFLAYPHAEYTVLANFRSSGQFRREDNINLLIKPTLPDLKQKTFAHFIDGITFGIMFGLALYNLFLFLSLKDRTYMWYSFYILLLSVSFICLFSSTPSKWTQYFLPDSPLLGFYIKKFADPILWISYVNFVRHFLGTKVNAPTWDNILKLCSALIAIQFIIDLTGIHYFTGVSRVIVWNLSVVICVVLAILSYIQGHSKAIFFLIGQFFFLIGIIITISFYAGQDLLAFLPRNAFSDYLRSPNALFIFGAIESILFSFALADKYNGLQKVIIQVRLEKEKEKQDLLSSQNELLEQRVEEQTTELRKSLEDLKATQAQLIQAEKMASLGALTAGIAHEIQNPLNFINNFSELNIELVEELGTPDGYSAHDGVGANSRALATLKKNSEKIHHHGQRMDAIVKSMLQHSRGGTTHLEEVDINDLCDECLRLSFHGFRATEKSFHSKYETDLCPNLPTTLGIKQDLGRVLLNIINNAFYAVNAKRNDLNREDEDGILYEPMVRVATTISLQDIIISITDNGSGIPNTLVDKIFQPFFTTKPSGEGTGLGLSLAYDIITKGHGGELKVRSKENLGTEFEIRLPIRTHK